MARSFLLSVLLLFSILHVGAQANMEAIQQQLQERGIEEQELRQRLEARGFTYTSLSDIPPEQMESFQTAVQEVIAEIEREREGDESAEQMESGDPTQVLTESEPEVVQDAAEAVEQGASVQEAVAEAMDKQEPDLPDARIWGHQIFRDQHISVFRQSDNIKPRDSYLLGSGDEVTISIWGVSILERTYTIDANGYIQPSGMPRIYLRGLTFADAKEKLKRQFASFNQFRDDEFEVSLRHARTISVGVFGEVFNPGNHTISAINTAFNLLMAAGGPTDIGTVRNIRWIRSTGDVELIDVYEYMNDPTISEAYYLDENDIVQIPIAQRIVSISGAIRRPMRYELIEGEQLQQLIEYAGGLKANAYMEVIQLKRFENDQQRVIDIPYNELLSSGGDFTLMNGDQIVIKEIPSPYRNFVSIGGTVELPGEYEYQDGMRILDLINRGKLVDESERSFAVLRRTNRNGTSNFIRVELEEILQNSSSSENILLAPADRLTVFGRGSFADVFQVTVSGQVRQPGTFEYDPSESMKVRDAVLLAGGLTPRATDFAYIIRRNIQTGEPEYIALDLAAVMADPNTNDNLVMRPEDRLIIQSQATFLDDATLTIAGAVRDPGTYEYDQSMTLRDLITLASGLRLQAASNRIDVSRLVIEENEPTRVVVATLQVDDQFEPVADPDFELQPYDQIFVRTVPEFEFQKTVHLNGEVRYPGPYTIIADNERISSIIERAGGITLEAFPEGATLLRKQDSIGPVVIELDAVLKNENIPSNIIMKDGDQIFIPKIKDFVAISGAVNTTELYRQDLLGENNRVTVVYDGSKSAAHYIRKFAGGFADNSSRKSTTVEYPNGEIRKAWNFVLFRIYPKVEEGSIVKVGAKPPKVDEPEGTEKQDVNWGEVMANAVAQATAVLTLILLIDRAGR